MDSRKKKNILRGMWLTVGVLMVVVAVLGYFIYGRLYTPNLTVKSDGFFYIHTGSSLDDVVKDLKSQEFLKDESTFRWTAQQMKYTDKIKPGRYKLKNGMSNRELVALLRSGKQTPVRLTFTTARTKQQLAEAIAKQLETQPNALLNLMDDPEYLHDLGFTSDNVMSLFLPNTYEIYWNTSADQFLKRMKKENDKFWNDTRTKKAEVLGLDKIQVSILASIVQQESNQEKEKPIIAGVYLNRYRKGWKLEADPTLVYALGDFSVNRVLDAYKRIDSPYNTYMYVGLPPGPICLPSAKSIDAVLNAVHHNYYFFCAREDFSGYHNFAATYQQHLVNARKFQKALDRRGIRS